MEYRRIWFSCLAIAVCIAELVGCVPQNNQSIPPGALDPANSQPATNAPPHSEPEQVSQQDLANALSEIERVLQQIPPSERRVKQIVRYQGVGVPEANDFFLQGARAAALTRESESYLAAQEAGYDKYTEVSKDADFFAGKHGFLEFVLSITHLEPPTASISGDKIAIRLKTEVEVENIGETAPTKGIFIEHMTAAMKDLPPTPYTARIDVTARDGEAVISSHGDSGTPLTRNAINAVISKNVGVKLQANMISALKKAALDAVTDKPLPKLSRKTQDRCQQLVDVIDSVFPVGKEFDARSLCMSLSDIQNPPFDLNNPPGPDGHKKRSVTSTHIGGLLWRTGYTIRITSAPTVDTQSETLTFAAECTIQSIDSRDERSNGPLAIQMKERLCKLQESSPLEVTGDLQITSSGISISPSPDGLGTLSYDANPTECEKWFELAAPALLSFSLNRNLGRIYQELNAEVRAYKHPELSDTLTINESDINFKDLMSFATSLSQASPGLAEIQKTADDLVEQNRPRPWVDEQGQRANGQVLAIESGSVVLYLGGPTVRLRTDQLASRSNRVLEATLQKARDFANVVNSRIAKRELYLDYIVDEDNAVNYEFRFLTPAP